MREAGSGRRHGGGGAAWEGDSWSYPGWDIRESHHGMLTDTSKGEPGFVLHRHSVLRRTGLHSPITPCSKRATVGLLQDAALLASLTVRVLTHLGLKASTPPVAVPVLYIVKGKR